MNTTAARTTTPDWPTVIEEALEDLQCAASLARHRDLEGVRDCLMLCRDNLPHGSRARALTRQLMNELRLGVLPTSQQRALLREYIEDALDEARAAQN